jgi:hypothetical protein
MDKNTFRIGSHVFPIRKATFRYIIDNGQGVPGWEFDIRTAELKRLTAKSVLYGRAPRFFAEGDPIPLENLKDLTGTEIFLKEPYDQKSGEVFFTLYVFEHGDLRNLKLKFLKKKGNAYRIRVTATVPKGTVFSAAKRLHINTWINQLPARRYGND